jgi:hypothetical protein
MDIFKELVDIEKIYEELINNAKDRNLKDIEVHRDNQQKIFESLISRKNDHVNNILSDISQKVNNKTLEFEGQLQKAIDKIESLFQKSIGNLQKLILKKLELDFK